MNLRKLVILSMLTALSVVLVMLVHFPLIPGAAFLEYDPADIPILIAAFMFGPFPALTITVITSILQGITVSSANHIYGIIMHILATGAFVCVAGAIYRKKQNKFLLALATAAGIISMTVVMVGANLIVTPIFLGMPVKAVRDMLLPIIIPFNLLKASINGIISFLIFIPLSNTIRRHFPPVSS